MKINKIFLVSIFILAIITLGAVSATDELTADNDDSLSTADEMDLQTAADDEVVSGDNEYKEDVYIDSIDGDEFISGDEVGIFISYDGEEEFTSQDFSLSIDGSEYNFTYDPEVWDVNFNTAGLALGSHDYTLKFIENENYYGSNSSGSFNIVEYFLDIPDSVECGYGGPVSIMFSSSPSMIGSILSVSIGDVTLSKNVTKDMYSPIGFVSFDVYDFNLSYGEQTVIAKLNGEIIKNQTMDVDYDIYVGDYYLRYGGEDFVISELMGIDLSDIIVEINGTSYPIYLYKTPRSNYLHVTGVKDLKPDIYDLTLTYKGDKFPKKSFNGTLEVEAVILSPEYILGNPENDVFRLTLPEDAKGNLTIYVRSNSESEFSKYVTVSLGGETIIPIENLSYGVYEYYFETEGVNYNIVGDDYYFTINPNIVLPTGQIMIGENATMSIDLPGENGTLSVRFIDEADYISEVDLVDGKATIQLANLKEGLNRLAVGLILIKYDDEGYSYAEYYSWKADVSIKPNLTLPSGKVMMGDKLFVTVDLPGHNGTLVVREDVKEGEGYAAELVNGKATVLIPKLDRAGKLNYYAYLTLTDYDSSENPYGDSYSYNGTLDVVNPITAADTSILYSANGKYKAQIKDLDGKAITSGKVTFYIFDGSKQILKKDVDIINGVATLSYAIKQGVKTYQIKTVYKTASLTKKLTVKHVLSLTVGAVKKSAKKLVLTGKLAKVNGKYLKGKTITFKFKGKTYKAKTNKKGVAKVTIKSTTLKKLKVGKKITVQATYIKDTVKKTIKVRK